METLSQLEERFGEKFFPAQLQAFNGTLLQNDPYLRACLFFPTGKGKTITALVCVQQQGHRNVLVMAPPRTHAQWIEVGTKMGMIVTAISHAKFRQKGYTLNQGEAMIVDEYHLLGGHNGVGWKKFSRVGKALKAPIVIMSATPFYNDAERCYCVMSVLDPIGMKGGFLEFLYNNCKTEQNPFGMTPNVTGFLQYKDAADYLAHQPRVYYIPDEAEYEIEDIHLDGYHDPVLEQYGFDKHKHKFIASDMERRKLYELRNMVDVRTLTIWPHVMDALVPLVTTAPKSVLMFAQRSSIASLLGAGFDDRMGLKVEIITGGTGKIAADRYLSAFKDGVVKLLIATSTIAAGADGLDKVCDTLILANDTDDDAQRRQIVGRVLPRGDDTDSSLKRFFRLVFH